MAVYVDNMQAKFGRMKMCHMVADTLEELFRMADAIGVQRKWFQPGSHPHFDIALSKRALAIEHGAILVDRRGLYNAMKRYTKYWKENPEELALIQRAVKNPTDPTLFS